MRFCNVFLFLFIFIYFSACRSIYSYKYYTLDLDEACYRTGKLLAEKPNDDVSFMICKPDENNKAPCVVMTSEEFFRWRLDYERLVEELEECQRRCKK